MPKKTAGENPCNVKVETASNYIAAASCFIGIL
jgi:hypothetical protein